MAKCDRASLAGYCQAWAEFADVSQKLEQTGLIVKTAAGNYIQNPLIPIRNRAVARFVSLAQQFGFTPSARTRLRALEEGHGQEEGNTDKSRFFRGAG
jgi:P27 family predicted phage terminase small subunit